MSWRQSKTLHAALRAPGTAQEIPNEGKRSRGSEGRRRSVAKTLDDRDQDGSRFICRIDEMRGMVIDAEPSHTAAAVSFVTFARTRYT